jgi:hypothetical protein
MALGGFDPRAPPFPEITEPPAGMVTWDGVDYALWSDASPQLAKGDHIRARLTPNPRRIDCGSGQQMQMNAVEHFG